MIPVDRKSLSAAFRATIPVLMGYLAIGMAFGLMLQKIGYDLIWAFFMSLTIYAGSGQYLGVSLLATGAALSTVAMMTLLINFRHLVYGLSMLEKFRGMGLRKLYMIFALTDETYALLSSAKAPEGVEPKRFYFYIALLDQLYWIAGSVIGAVAGAVLPIDTTGVDFAMTALFLVIAVDQWQSVKSHFPALLGGIVTVISLAVVGADNMLLPALGVMVLVLLLSRKKLDDPGVPVAQTAGTDTERKEGPAC
nr:AzlC family ABC transporter permease [Pseudoflavonifractor sp. MSJ-37]